MVLRCIFTGARCLIGARYILDVRSEVLRCHHSSLDVLSGLGHLSILACQSILGSELALSFRLPRWERLFLSITLTTPCFALHFIVPYHLLHESYRLPKLDRQLHVIDCITFC